MNRIRKDYFAKSTHFWICWIIIFTFLLRRKAPRKLKRSITFFQSNLFQYFLFSCKQVPAYYNSLSNLKWLILLNCILNRIKGPKWIMPKWDIKYLKRYILVVVLRSQQIGFWEVSMLPMYGFLDLLMLEGVRLKVVNRYHVDILNKALLFGGLELVVLLHLLLIIWNVKLLNKFIYFEPYFIALS